MMKLGNQIMVGYKCPTCKKFGLRPTNLVVSGMNCIEREGHDPHALENRYTCKNCYAMYQAIGDEQ